MLGFAIPAQRCRHSLCGGKLRRIPATHTTTTAAATTTTTTTTQTTAVVLLSFCFCANEDRLERIEDQLNREASFKNGTF